MRKGLIVSLLILTVFMTGCGKKESEKVVCTKEESDTSVGYDLKTEVIGTLENNNVIQEDLKMTMTFKEEKWAKSSYDLIKEEMDGEADVTIDGSVITVKQKTDYEEPMAKEEFIDSYTFDLYTCE